MATPAVAKWFVVLQEESEIPSVIEFCEQQSCDFLVLGEGSNSVFLSDIDLLVIANRIGGAGTMPDLFECDAMRLLEETDDYCDFAIGAGVNWHQLVEQSLNSGYFGLERLALIPGLVGAAPIQNIGAYGSELSEFLQTVRAYDVKKKSFVNLVKSDCQFSYRDSIFKQQAGRYIITEVTLRLQKKQPTYQVELLYPALAKRFSDSNVEEVSAQEVFASVCDVRRSKLPSPKRIPNSGSFFKNPVVSNQQFESIKKDYPEIVSFPVAEGVKLAAGWLIDQLGFKGHLNESGIGCYEKQALVITNQNKQPGKEVFNFTIFLQMQVQRHFGVTMEIEPRLYASSGSRLQHQS